MSDKKHSASTSKKEKKLPPRMITQYAKRKFVKTFSLNGSGLQASHHIIGYEHRGNPEDVIAYINNVAKSAQEHVEEEVDSDEFTAIEKWVQFAKSHKFNSDCGFELPLLLKAIAASEDFPECDPTTDVDFRLLYTWLAEVMLGNAPPDLNPQSQVFLIGNLTDLLSIIESPEKENELIELKRAFKAPVPPKDEFSKSVDPLQLCGKKRV